MREHDETTYETNAVQNRFTAYLVTAVKNRKSQYLQSKAKIQKHEQSLELPENSGALLTEPDMSFGLPIMEQIENMKLHKALEQARMKELYILFAKVLDGRSFVEIAAELGVKPNTVAVAYYRFIERLKEELRGENE